MSADRCIHVVDDDDAVRGALAALLMSAGFAVRAYPSAEAFLAGVEQAQAGCVITDVQMPGLTGLDLLARLKLRSRDFAVIVLTGLGDVPMAVQALKEGASDFLEKPFGDEQLLTAVGAALDRQAARSARGGSHAECAERLAKLSPRERDVLRGLVAGASSKQIALDLDISPRTVETYRAGIMGKTRAGSLSELVRIALRAEEDPV
jgi:two-component system, LuxR family, response regulator FixJ